MFRTLTLGCALILTACAVPTPTIDSEAPDVGVDDEALVAARSCLPRQCGPQPGLPDRICPDGVTVAGPTGRCLAQPDGSCGWEIISCPTPVCAVVSFGAPGAETGFVAQNFRTAARAKAWFRRFSNASLDILEGTCGSQHLACPLFFKPVCAVVSGSGQQTFGNRCELRRATIAAAGDSGGVRSRVQSEGACPTACASSTQCAEGEHCTVEDGDCDPTPGCTPGRVCPDLCYGVCAPNAPKGPFCAGFAGIPCKGSAHCIDDPSDDCDPEHGGADCGGICVCVETELCVQGSHFNSDPNVCACEPDGVQCGKTVCAADQICCSPTCGICGSKGGLCPAIACQVPLN